MASFAYEIVDQTGKIKKGSLEADDREKALAMLKADGSIVTSLGEQDALSKDIVKATITPDTDKMGRLCVQALEEYQQTGYTNGYETVDLKLVTSGDARKLLVEQQKEEEEK